MIVRPLVILVAFVLCLAAASDAAEGAKNVVLFVVVGREVVRELFEQAPPPAPCIVFLDAIDAVGGRLISSLEDLYASLAVMEQERLEA